MSTRTKDGTFRDVSSLLSLLGEALYFEVFSVVDLFRIVLHNLIKSNLMVGKCLN